MHYREPVTLTPAQRAELEDATAETNLLVLASAYVLLKPRWMTPRHIYVGVCPFHYERTDSFTVDAHENRFYCIVTLRVTHGALLRCCSSLALGNSGNV